MQKQTMILSILLLVTAMAFAEGPQGSITGLIIDQNNNPVEGVTVRAVTKEQAATAGADELLTTQTDQDGKFIFSAVTGDIKITAVKKGGYICTAGQIKKANKKASRSLSNPPQGDPQPIIIKIHKKAGPVFLHNTTSQFRFKAKDLSDDVFLDMKHGRDVSTVVSKRIEKDQAEKPNDVLHIQCAYDSAQKQYQLTLTCPEEGTGIIVTDELLYEAPADGYAPQGSLNVSYANDKAKKSTAYLYLKSNDKKKDRASFTRMQVQMIAGKAELIAEIQTWTNPKGERNLEYNENFQQKYIAKRLKEINAAIEDGSATDEQVQQMHELVMMQRENNIKRWDFDGNRRRAAKKKIEQQRDVNGRTRPRKRTFETRK